MINKKIKDIEDQIEDLKTTDNAVTKDLTENALISAFENLIYYTMYERLGEGETYSDEELQSMYDAFEADEEFEKCKLIKRIQEI